MRLPLTYLAVIALLTACGQRDDSRSSSDANLRKTLAGTWTRQNAGMVILAPDGTYTSRFTNAPGNQIWQSEGRWAVADRVVIYTVSKSRSWGTTNREPVGAQERCRIIKVDDREFVWEWQGKTNWLTRLK